MDSISIYAVSPGFILSPFKIFINIIVNYWDNPAVKKGLEAKGICIINALDVIDAVLLPGEKDRIMDIIDDVKGFKNEELKAETAKN